MAATRSKARQSVQPAAPSPAPSSASSSTAVARPSRVRRGRNLKVATPAPTLDSGASSSTDTVQGSGMLDEKEGTPSTTNTTEEPSSGDISDTVIVYISNSDPESSDAYSDGASADGDSDSDDNTTTSDAEEDYGGNDTDLEESDGEDDDFVETPIRGTKRRATSSSAGPSFKKITKKTETKNLSAAEMMPVFSDINIFLGQPAIKPDSDSHQDPPGVRRNIATTLRKMAAQREKNKKNAKKNAKPKKRTLRDTLEGDIPGYDYENSTEIDPRDLPTNDVDYSKFSLLFSSHPHLRLAWGSLPPPPAPQKIGQPADLKIRLLPFQQEGVWWMARQEGTPFRGGILADEMGMGKTLQTISLMLVNRGKPTLVICPTVALLQWKSEIQAATNALSVLVFYGNERKKLVDAKGHLKESELDKYDVILTTYSVLESSFRRERYGFRVKGELHKEKSLLHTIDWFRIVLDEAHNIKDRSTNSARAAFELKCKHGWSLTGTPLHNRVGELYSLIRLTKSDPFSMYFCHSCECKSLHWLFKDYKSCTSCGHSYTTHFCYWNMHVMNPIQNMPVKSLQSQVAFKKLDKLLDNVMLRRTKVERAEDMGLPPRIVVTRRDKFNPEEEDFYVSLFSDYQREFDTYAQHGTVLNNYANIFELITRMRLAANHPDLLRLKVDAHSKTGNNAGDNLVCAICNEEAEDPIISKCKHVFCRADAQMYVSSADDTTALRCPSCYALFDIDLTQPEMRHPGEAGNSGSGDNGASSMMETMLSTPKTTEYRRSIINRIDMRNWKSSSKIEALVEELSKHRQGNASIKSIVFSQFVNFLDLIQWRLNRAGFSVCRLDGRMSPSQRDAVIRTFMTHPEYTVFLVSLKAGGVALNLTEASNVYLADCWWNPSVEVQAMDRIHRMGQYRPIKVTRIIIENSIESRIIALQVKKQHLVNSTIGRDKKSLDKLSAQDMHFLFS
ncbi:DNA repair protein rad16 [Dipsacomyces acuminosporus]|nr:DNA repair protein rad16 [Dipsacomyces acuminosporus]